MGMRLHHDQSRMSQSQSINTQSNNWQKLQSGLNNVMKSLQSGDLATAQKTFNSLNIDASKLNGNNPLGQLASALQNGNLADAQKAASNIGQHETQQSPSNSGAEHAHHSHHSSHSTDSGNLMKAVTASLTNTLNSQTSATQGANNSNAASAAQALGNFMQNLMSALNGSSTTSSAVDTTNPLTQIPQTPTASQIEPSTPANGSADTATGTDLTDTGRSKINSYSNNGAGSLQSNLSGLLQEFTANATTGASPSATSISLQNSFNTYVQALGGQADSSTLNSFLQNLQTSLQAGGTGNLISKTA
jgi:hypothetical protein